MKRMYIFVGVIVGVIFLLPNILFYIEDYQREQTYTELSKQQLISTEVDNMYLVNQLHFLDYQGIDYIYDPTIQKVRHEALIDEVKKMKEFGLIKEDVWNKFTAIQEERDFKVYTFNRSYSYEESYTTANDGIYVGNIEMEAKTNKLIKFYLFSDEPVAKDEATLKKYIQYLGLDVVDDWQMVDEGQENDQDVYMISKKAKLKVYTNTDRIVMYQNTGYQNMYRILFSVDTVRENNIYSIEALPEGSGY